MALVSINIRPTQLAMYVFHPNCIMDPKSFSIRYSTVSPSEITPNGGKLEKYIHIVCVTLSANHTQAICTTSNIIKNFERNPGKGGIPAKENKRIVKAIAVPRLR